ncbi:MAG: CBS domain-containing protein [Gallionellaceae bacterium]|nr:MAG: CBS domain-containing protein [Gallionellaceae bacterium]
MGHQKPNTLQTFSEVSNILAPSNEPWQVELNDPATSVMTDFRVRALFKVDPEDTLDEALQKMKIAGLRIGFVVDSAEKIHGMITSYDIMGEKPMRYLQSVGFADRGVTHKDIKVKDIMEKPEDWVSTEIKNVETVTVQGVLDAFQRTGRTHLPVLDHRDGKEHHLRGLFSSAKVLRLTDFARRKAAQSKA